MKYLYSVAIFMLIYGEKKDVLKRFKIYSRYIRKGKVMLTINQLMKYLRSKHNIAVKSNQAQDLRNMGYYHGFKGYRFIRVPSQRISFTSLDEIIALNKFDMQLKALFYPKVMFIENALKSYVIESTLKNAKSENLDVIFNKSITDYRSYTPGSDMYHKQYAKRMMLKGKINSALIRDYGNNKKTVNLVLCQDLVQVKMRNFSPF